MVGLFSVIGDGAGIAVSVLTWVELDGEGFVLCQHDDSVGIAIAVLTWLEVEVGGFVLC